MSHCKSGLQYLYWMYENDTKGNQMNLQTEIPSSLVQTVICDEIGISGVPECFDISATGMLVAFNKLDSPFHFIQATEFMTPVLAGIFTAFLVLTFGMVFLVAFSSKGN